MNISKGNYGNIQNEQAENPQNASVNLIEFSSTSIATEDLENSSRISNVEDVNENMVVISSDQYEPVRLAYFETPFNFYLQIETDELVLYFFILLPTFFLNIMCYNASFSFQIKRAFQ